MLPRFEIFKDSRGQYRFRLRSPNYEIIISSSDTYTTKVKCREVIESIKSNIPNTKIEDKTIKLVKSSFAWYFLPILLAFMGSLIGYFALKSKDKKLAQNVVAIGIIASMVWVGLFIFFPDPNIEQSPIATTPVTPQISISPTINQPSTSTSTTTIPSTAKLSSFKVKEVIDGDSIVLDDDTDVRLLGINAPEEGYPFEEEARDRLSSLILGKEVRLESDFDDKDRYGRLLRYIFVGDIFVNIQLVKEGLANVYMESGLKYEDELNEAEYYAKLNALGIWKKDVAYADYIHIVKFHYDAAGNDHENLNDEYVVLGNKGDIPIDMTGWTIKDEANHIFTFPQFVLESEANVTIYTGFGTNSEKFLYWNNQGAIWNNNGDTLYIRNVNGELIFSHEY